jgi:hypothetical protein
MIARTTSTRERKERQRPPRCRNPTGASLTERYFTGRVGANVELDRQAIGAVNAHDSVYWKSYSQGVDALGDLGVSEDQLKPIAP